MNLLLRHRQHWGNPANQGRVLSRTAALALLNDWVKNERLRLHMHQTAHLMKCWAAEQEGLDAEAQWKWELAGLLHDADWDQWPEQHCVKIVEELEKRELDPEVIRAIASHGPAHFGVEPESRMDQMLYAFDELSGLTHAYSLMRPGGYAGMEVKGLMKRFRDQSFAANVSRDEVKDAMRRASLELETVMAFIIRNQAAMSRLPGSE